MYIHDYLAVASMLATQLQKKPNWPLIIPKAKKGIFKRKKSNVSRLRFSPAILTALSSRIIGKTRLARNARTAAKLTCCWYVEYCGFWQKVDRLR